MNRREKKAIQKVNGLGVATLHFNIKYHIPNAFPFTGNQYRHCVAQLWMKQLVTCLAMESF